MRISYLLLLRRAGMAILLFTLAACGSGGGGTGTSPDNGDSQGAPVPPPAPAAVEYDRSVLVNGLSHAYLAYVPGSAQTGIAVPVVIYLHGGSSNAQTDENLTRLRDTADDDGFVLLEAQGYARDGEEARTWNAGACCGEAQLDDVDQVAAVSAMLDDLATLLPVDSKRVYATGFSNGAMMDYRLACALSTRIAAIAPVSGMQINMDDNFNPPRTVFTCTATQPVAILHLHGMADTCAPFAGGTSTGSQPTARPPVMDGINFWVSRNRCRSGPVQTYSSGGTTCQTWSRCQSGTEITLCTTTTAGHVWPGSPGNFNAASCGGAANLDYSANDMMWSFFQAHPKP